MITIGTYSVKEYADPNLGSYSQDSTTLYRTFIVAAADLEGFITYMLGGVVNFAAQSNYLGGQPYKVGSPYVALHAELLGLGKAGQDTDYRIKFPTARVRFSYGAPPIDQIQNYGAFGTRTYIETDVQYHLIATTIPGKSLIWADTTKTLDHAEALFEVYADITMTRSKLAYTDFVAKKAALVGLMGKVNQVAWQGYPEETLLFNGFNPKFAVDARGKSLACSLSIGLKLKPTEWNKMWRAGTGYVGVLRVGGGAKPYPYAMFGDVLGE